MESTRKSIDLAQTSQKIIGFFHNVEIESLARKIKFVQRSSRMTGTLFVKTMVCGYIENSRATLLQLAQMGADLSVTISPQGLDERISAASTAFLKDLFAQAIQTFQSQQPLVLPILQQFSAIDIVDSTTLPLPEEMQDLYPGCGGGGPTASLKIQLVFEFLCGNLKQVVLQPGRCADQAYRDYLELLRPGSLTLVDLGYFCLDAFRAIIDRQAYFLSRYLYPTALLTPQGERIDLLPWLRTQTADRFERDVLLGCRKKHQLPSRLIVVRVPLAVAEERRRKAIEKARQHHKQLSHDYLELLGWSLFLTNVPAERLSSEQVSLLYHVRWQIELIFKLWKSYCGLNDIHLWRRERVLTELYAKMIGCVIFQFLIASLRIPDETWSNRELSLVQARLILSRFAVRFAQALPDPVAFCLLISDLLDHFARFAAKQKRVKHPNVCQSLANSLA